MSSDDFVVGLQLIREAYITALKDFVGWSQKHLVLEPEEKWPSDDPPPPSAEYRRGYEAAIKELDAALDCYLEEFPTC